MQDKVNKSVTLTGSYIPERLLNISEPPKTLHILGSDLSALLSRPTLAIVGTRSVSPYGRVTTNKFASELAANGVVIVSGLALGVDSIAHQAALDAGGPTIAVLPSGIKRIYPSSHTRLAREIVEKGGVIVSEKNDDYNPRQFDFLERNRLISGLADAVLITEAAIRSGSLNTARHALDQGKTVMAVPGNINSGLSEGTNNLLKMGATVVTSVEDIYQALGWRPIAKAEQLSAHSEEEVSIMKQLRGKISVSGEELLQKSGLTDSQFFETMTMLEINGIIAPLGNNNWTLK